jgi:hypothetical protein
MARDYKKEYREFGGTAKQKKNRAARNKARREMIKAGKAAKGDGKDVGHKKALHNGGSNGKSNVRVESRKTNRAEGASIREGKKKRAKK